MRYRADDAGNANKRERGTAEAGAGVMNLTDSYEDAARQRKATALVNTIDATLSTLAPDRRNFDNLLLPDRDEFRRYAEEEAGVHQCNRDAWELVVKMLWERAGESTT